MRALIGLLPTTEGSIRFRGEPVERLSAHRRARLGIGYVPQGRDVFPRMSVEENLRIGRAAGRGGADSDFDLVYSSFPILRERRRQVAGTLSGGQQQQLAIGRVLIARPALMLLDEPSEGIQPSIVQDIARIAIELNRRTGLTIVLVEQNIDMIRAMAQRCYVMDKGRLVANTHAGHARRSRDRPAPSGGLTSGRRKCPGSTTRSWHGAAWQAARPAATTTSPKPCKANIITSTAPTRRPCCASTPATSSPARRTTRSRARSSTRPTVPARSSTSPFSTRRTARSTSTAPRRATVSPSTSRRSSPRGPQPVGTTCLITEFGGLVATGATALLNPPLPEKVKKLEVTVEGGVKWSDRITLPYEPFIGTIGTSPEIEAISSLVPDYYGGNMDLPDVGPGAVIYLPVNAPGALLYLGDCHAIQGDGELCGVALEHPTHTTVHVDLIKSWTLHWPRLETAEFFMTIGSGRPMEDAARIAYRELVRWIVAEFGFDAGRGLPPAHPMRKSPRRQHGRPEIHAGRLGQALHRRRAPPMIDVVELTVEQVQAGFATGAFTCEALTQACLDRIAAYDANYNAIVFPNPAALDDARAIDRRRAAGEPLGPLAGVPIVVKDTMDMVGFPSTGGWRLLCSKVGGIDLMPGTDAPVVARMRAAGAIILGKTNVPVLSASGSHANDSWAGPTYNAAGRAFVPGGSSAGSATSVAASFAVLGLAEETGGSIQNPASAQALVGIKPTFALVPNAGVMPLSSQRDVVGPLARCVRDAALALDVLAGFTMADPKTTAAVGRIPRGGYAAGLVRGALRGKRLGLYGPGWRNLPLSDSTETLYARAQRELAQAGATLLPDPFAGTGFAAIAQPVPGPGYYDARGIESVPFDLHNYLLRMGPNAALRSFADFAAATQSEDPFRPGGVLAYMHGLRQFAPCLANPTQPPDMTRLPRRAARLSLDRPRDARRSRASTRSSSRRCATRCRRCTRASRSTRPRSARSTSRACPASSCPPATTTTARRSASSSSAGPGARSCSCRFAYDYEQATHHRRAPRLEAAA